MYLRLVWRRLAYIIGAVGVLACSLNERALAFQTRAAAMASFVKRKELPHDYSLRSDTHLKCSDANVKCSGTNLEPPFS